MNVADTLARALKNKPHSFEHVRKATGLELTDEQLLAVVETHPDRFQATRFVQRDAEGNRVQPGLPGARLRTGGA
jgi:hypothetical protein